MEQIRFKISYRKAIEALVWLAKMRPGIDIYHVAKVLFYADKMHINRYARPVIGDTYIRMPYGPVPSGIRDLITENPWLSPKQQEEVRNSLNIEDVEHRNIKARREPDMDYFSKSDIECLTDSLNRYGELPFDDLFKSTHSEKCYHGTEPNEKIDYALLIDDDNPHQSEILNHMREVSQYVQM